MHEQCRRHRQRLPTHDDARTLARLGGVSDAREVPAQLDRPRPEHRCATRIGRGSGDKECRVDGGTDVAEPVAGDHGGDGPGLGAGAFGIGHVFHVAAGVDRSRRGADRAAALQAQGAEPVLGTNPIAVAAPAGRFDTFCLDMATSTVPRGRIEVAARRGWSLPVGWAIDADGNDLPGVRLPQVAVPTGTYLGWNLRKAGYGEGDLCLLSGSYLPLARDAASRGGDSRASMAERYPLAGDREAKKRAAAVQLAKELAALPQGCMRREAHCLRLCKI